MRLELQTFQQIGSMKTAYLGKICLHSSEQPFVKSDVFLFSSTSNKEKDPFLFEK